MWRWDTNLIEHSDDEDGNTYELLPLNDHITFTCKKKEVIRWQVLLVVQDNLTMNGYLEWPGTPQSQWLPLGHADLFGAKHDFQRTFAQALYTKLPSIIPGYKTLDFHFDLHYVMQ